MRAGWRFSAEWRLGRIELITEGALWSAQVLAESADTTIGEPFDLSHPRSSSSFRRDEYRLRR